jgi:hypothetical protein
MKRGAPARRHVAVVMAERTSILAMPRRRHSGATVMFVTLQGGGGRRWEAGKPSEMAAVRAGCGAGPRVSEARWARPRVS